MASRTWTGGTTGVAQVVTITVNTSTAANTYTVTLTDEVGGTATVSFTAGDTNTTTTATGIKAAIAASADPRFLAVTATSATNVVTITAGTAGVPFYPTIGGTGSAQMTLATPTASKGPKDWNTPGNWVEETVPVGGDNVTLTGSNAILYGTKTGLTLGAFLAAPGFSGACGLFGQNLSFICTSFAWYGTGQSFVDILTSAIAPTVYATASSSAPQAGLNLYGSAMTTLNVYNGSVGLAMSGGSTASVTTIQLVGSNAGSARVVLTSGVTCTNLTMANGTAVVGCALTLLSAEAGTVTTVGSGAITTLTNNGATVYPVSSGTITTLNQNSGTVDFTTSVGARTVTTPHFYGGIMKFDPGVITFTNKPDYTATGPQTVTIS